MVAYPEDWDTGKSDCHLPYPEEDMELFRNGIREADFVLPSEVAPWIELLESGHQDPILVLLLSLLPNLRILSLDNHPGQTLLITNIRRIAENAASKSFSEMKSFRLSDSIVDQSEGVSLFKAVCIATFHGEDVVSPPRRSPSRTCYSLLPHSSSKL